MQFVSKMMITTEAVVVDAPKRRRTSGTGSWNDMNNDVMFKH
jgi:hypothetical protein